MPQGGLDWEMIAMVAAAASGAVIVWDWIAGRGGAQRSETRKGILEVAWPVLFIACMGLLLKLTDFAAVLLLAAVITGLIWLYDAKWARKRRLSDVPEPVVVDMARAFFPVIVVAFVKFPGGVNMAATLLMLMGTQWYMLFNVIAGSSAIPLDLRYTTDLLRLSSIDRWRRLILPALFPYLVTGAIIASGGAWNASIVAEHVSYGGEVYTTTGVGAVIAQATGQGNYPLLLAATLALVMTVVTINRTVWRRLYRLAEVRYRLD